MANNDAEHYIDHADLQYITEHVFMPPKISESEHEDRSVKDYALLAEISKAVALFQQKLGTNITKTTETWGIISHMLNAMQQIHPTETLIKDSIETELRSMNIGDVLPIYIASQNAGIIFRRPSAKELSFESFEISLPNEVITSTLGKVVMQYPANHRLFVPADNNIYSTLAGAISFLSARHMKEVVPVVRKAGGNQANVRDTVSPRYITECLAGVLRGFARETESGDTIFIRKRIDDRVMMSAGKDQPWRRSAMWLLVRVSLQTVLEEHGIEGGEGYKAFQAFFMAQLLEKCIYLPNRDLLPDDVIDWMNRKVARRMWKMKKFVDKEDSPTLKSIGETISRVSTTLQSHWDRIRKHNTTNDLWVAPTQQSIKEALNFSLKNNQHYLHTVASRTRKLAEASTEHNDEATIQKLVSSCSKRLDPHSSDLPTSINTTELDVGLMDFESWVEKSLPSWSKNSSLSDCTRLSAIMEEYMKLGQNHYSTTPERVSLFWLTLMELWVALDKLAVNAYQLLEEYSPEIEEGFLDHLLLPLASQMKRLHAVQSYIRDRREAGKNSVFGDINSPQSFQNVYFSTSSQMQKQKSMIEDWAAGQREEVMDLMEAANEKYHELLEEAGKLECEYFRAKTQYGDYIQRHSSRCRKHALQQEASDLRTPRFEDPLPYKTHQANVIVFELNCPKPFGVWREVTYHVLLLGFTHSSTDDAKLYKLQQYTPTKRFHKARERRLTIASSTVCIANSSEGTSSPLPANEEAILFPHSGVYKLCYNDEWLLTREQSKLQPLCTFHLDEPYDTLQRFIEDTTHSPNSVIASQDQCPVLLNLTEYQAFGQLRAGHKIQLWNIMRVLINDSLSLNEAGVHSLLMQTLWQAGPNKDSNAWYREVHPDLLNNEFAEDMLLVLHDALQRVGESGREVLYLATLTALTTRLLSLTPDTGISGKCLSLLEKFREKAAGWMKDVEKEMTKSTRDDSAKLQHKMALIAIVWRLTFDVEDGDLETLCKSPTNISALLFGSMTIAADGTQTTSLPQAIQLLIRRDKALAYRLEPYIAQALQRDPGPLHAVAKRIWKAYHEGSNWEKLQANGCRWWTCRTASTGQLVARRVYVNILSGEFLIDGKTVDRLPQAYIAHGTYQHLFEKSISLRCHLSTLQGMEYEASYLGIQVHFAMLDSSLVVRVLRQGSIEEYIPSNRIEGDVPSSFIHNHQHWYIENEGSERIEFRPTKFQWIHDLNKNWTMALTTVARGLHGSLRKNTSFGLQEALDPHSQAFNQLHKSVEGVEPSAFGMTAILATGTQDSLLNITLTNHNLDFFVSPDGCLASRTFPDYILDTDRDIGCLYGLVNRIVLCDKSASQRVRKVVIPRGQLKASKTSRSHPIVLVKAALKEGFHVYDVDTLIGRLLGNGTMESDLFLIQLHALTASYCPDPLTGRTGTEEALDMLEGSSLLSHYELTTSWRTTMEQIASISPQRAYFPQRSKVMEQVSWNPDLPMSSQHPEFSKQVARILSYWSRMDLQNTNSEFTTPIESPPGMVELSHRASLRGLRTTTEHSALRKYVKDDVEHVCRDIMHRPDSRKREATVYQVACCTNHLTAGLPVCATLEREAKIWSKIQPRQSWGWGDFSQWFGGSVSGLWTTLYNLCCIASRDEGPSRFGAAMALSMLAYQSEIPLSILGTLVAVIRLSQFQKEIFNHPVKAILNLDRGCDYDDFKIYERVKSCQIGFEKSVEANLENAPGATHDERLRLRRKSYTDQMEQEARTISSYLREWFASGREDYASLAIQNTARIRGLEDLVHNIFVPTFETWNRNKRFLWHLARVDRELRQESSVGVPAKVYQQQPVKFQLPYDGMADVRIEYLMREGNLDNLGNRMQDATMPTDNTKASATNHESKVKNLRLFIDGINTIMKGQIEERYIEDFKQSVDAFSKTVVEGEAGIPTETALDDFREKQKQSYQTMHEQITKPLQPTLASERLLEEAGLWPCVTVRTLLSKLSLRQREHTPKEWIEWISLYANQVISFQRSKRLFHYGTRNMVAEYSREFLHCRPRKSLSHPDWLLIEIDADMCIRSDQTDVANAMISPDDGKNMVTQLNMGEGKSSVIVPVAAATLANTKQLVRVVVLKPQSKLQLNLLRGRLARLVNRRIICLPFSRDLKVDKTTATKISSILEACLKDGGIWLCQPEHLLSFKLLGLDLAMRMPTNPTLGIGLTKCQLWIEKHTRDILDESDEILHTRHQLVYTVGNQGVFDAAPDRWEIVQQILSLVQRKLASNPSEDFLVGPCETTGQFPSIRMMSDNGSDFFHKLSKDIVFNAVIPSIRMVNLSVELKEAALLLLTERNIPAGDQKEKITSLQEYCKENDETLLWQCLLLLRGLIAFNILPLALQNKRWRVDYGPDFRRSQLAVPYRAKDSPSLRSDFAHPDVLIILTCLTYYYGGLEDSMIIRTVKELLKLDDPDLTYEQWVSSQGVAVPKHLRKLTGLDIEDDRMIVDSLGPSLRHNKRAIDFFLNRCVFPREAKDFPLRMSTSGWDLAMEKVHPTTGFSGTNDLRFLLPTSIVQHNSSAQQHTNATVIANILLKDNATVVPYDNGLESKEILKRIFDLEDRPRVLLDVGAQILDCANAELVKAWLLMYDENGPVKAAVYFDDDDNMCVMERDGSIQSFSDSPYSSRLEECLVYLDDAHTRGTDLKLPACRAAVTVGPRLCKDKFVQGCMRMRKLGTQHKIVFLAPDEVIGEVKKLLVDQNATVQSFHILQWTMQETCRQLQTDIASWAAQGYEFAERQTGWGRISDRLTKSTEIEDLFCQKEGKTLEYMYGIGDGTSFRQRSNYIQTSASAMKIVEAIDTQCRLFNPFSFIDARTQEEQEVELMQEKEVEREIERPPSADPAPHSLHPHVQDFVTTGVLDMLSPAFLDVGRSFEGSSLVLPSGGANVFMDLVVTHDFYCTIKQTTPNGTTDDFLRPVEWVVTSQDPRAPALVVLSPYEVDQLFTVIRSSTKVKLHLFASRTSLSMRTLDDFRLFTLPRNFPATNLNPRVIQQIDLYSGTLYLPDLKTYRDMCALLRLHFGKLPADTTNIGVINSNGYVKDFSTRNKLALTGEGFEEDPVQFLRKLFHLRRNGRSFFPSHMGQILFGMGLTEATFETQAKDDDRATA